MALADVRTVKEATNVASIVQAVDKVISLFAASISILCVITLFLSLGADVVVRYLTTQSLGWPSELPMLLFPWLVMGGIVVAAQKGSHVSVNVLLFALNKQAARILMLAIQAVVAVTFFSLANIGMKVIAITGGEIYPMTGLQAKWAYWALIAGFVGIGVTAVTTFCRLMLGADPYGVRDDDAGE